MDGGRDPLHDYYELGLERDRLDIAGDDGSSVRPPEEDPGRNRVAGLVDDGEIQPGRGRTLKKSEGEQNREGKRLRVDHCGLSASR